MDFEQSSAPAANAAAAIATSHRRHDCSIQTCVEYLLLAAGSLSTIAATTLWIVEQDCPGTATGYMSCAFASVVGYVQVRRLRTQRTISDSVDALKAQNAQLRQQNTIFDEENRELQTTNDDLRATSEALRADARRYESIANEARKDVDMFKAAIGVFGDESDHLLENMHRAWQRYTTENNRHAQLLRAQTRLHLIDIVRHFDKSETMMLSPDEFNTARAYLHAAFPRLDLDALHALVEKRDITVQTLMLELDKLEDYAELAPREE